MLIYYNQGNTANCGATCLKMIAKFFDREFDLEYIVKISNTDSSGTTISDLSGAAGVMGFVNLPVSITLDRLTNEAPLPCILHWRNNHFVILYEIKKDLYILADPALGLLFVTKKDFAFNWLNTIEINEISTLKGRAILFEKSSEPKY